RQRVPASRPPNHAQRYSLGLRVIGTTTVASARPRQRAPSSTTSRTFQTAMGPSRCPFGACWDCTTKRTALVAIPPRRGRAARGGGGGEGGAPQAREGGVAWREGGGLRERAPANAQGNVAAAVAVLGAAEGPGRG